MGGAQKVLLGVLAVGAAGGLIWLLAGPGTRPAHDGERFAALARLAEAPARAPAPLVRPPPPGPPLPPPSPAPAPAPAPAPPLVTAGPVTATAKVDVSVPMDEVDKLAAKLALRPDQRERLREVFRDGSEEMARELRAYSERAMSTSEADAPPGEAGGFRAITDAAARRIEDRVRALLDQDQRARFDAIVEEDKKTAAEAPR